MKELRSEFEKQIATAQRMNEHIRKQSLTMLTVCLKRQKSNVKIHNVKDGRQKKLCDFTTQDFLMEQHHICTAEKKKYQMSLCDYPRVSLTEHLQGNKLFKEKKIDE